MADPFSVLGLSPTLDLASVKRAYFAQLQKHPPHADPQGFRELRAAYESLLAPGALALAFVAAPFDPAPELAAWRERWSEPMKAAAAKARADAQEKDAARLFVERASRLTLREALARTRDA